MALQGFTIVWPKTHQNCQRDEASGFLVFALERREAHVGYTAKVTASSVTWQ